MIIIVRGNTSPVPSVTSRRLLSSVLLSRLVMVTNGEAYMRLPLERSGIFTRRTYGVRFMLREKESETLNALLPDCFARLTC